MCSCLPHLVPNKLSGYGNFSRLSGYGIFSRLSGYGNSSRLSGYGIFSRLTVQRRDLVSRFSLRKLEKHSVGKSIGKHGHGRSSFKPKEEGQYRPKTQMAILKTIFKKNRGKIYVHNNL